MGCFSESHYSSSAERWCGVRATMQNGCLSSINSSILVELSFGPGVLILFLPLPHNPCAEVECGLCALIRSRCYKDYGSCLMIRLWKRSVSRFPCHVCLLFMLSTISSFLLIPYFYYPWILGWSSETLCLCHNLHLVAKLCNKDRSLAPSFRRIPSLHYTQSQPVDFFLFICGWLFLLIHGLQQFSMSSNRGFTFRKH